VPSAPHSCEVGVAPSPTRNGCRNRGEAQPAKIDAVDLTSQEVRDWLSELPIGKRAELHVAWIADRLGARMSFETFTANVDDLWFPAMDDVVSVLHSGSDLMVLVLDHEELITLSSAELSRDDGQGPTR